MTHKERLAYLEALPDETISPVQLSKVLGGMPYVYNVAAKQGRLTLPYMWRGCRLRIFKQPVIRLLSSGEATNVMSVLTEDAG